MRSERERAQPRKKLARLSKGHSRGGDAGTISGRTKLCFILGWPVDHSCSPAMQNAAFRALELPWIFLPWAVRPDHLKGALAGIRAMDNCGGGNLTIPHKEAAIAHLDSLSPEAELIGAVNTIRREQDGGLRGHNTDGIGFLRALSCVGRLDPAGLRAVVLGAGGAARGVAVALAGAGVASLAILNRHIGRAEALVAMLAEKYPNTRSLALGLQQVSRDILEETDLIINATPVGMGGGDACFLDVALLPRLALVCDLIYRPPLTPLLQAARRRGCRILNGEPMLLYQGAAALEFWTGQKAPVAVMRQALRRAVRGN